MLLGLCAPAAAAATATGEPFPLPAELQPDVEFWVRVYSAISTNEGYIHDGRNLSVVYETVRFAPELPPRERQAMVDAVRERYQAILRYLATGAPARDADDQRVRDLWPAELPPQRLAQAVDEVRFQLGQSERFRDGLVRAGALAPAIAATLRAAALPDDLAVLPHVESSFDAAAASKVGAAGLWQFMSSTGRRFLRIDSAVDERFDPYRSTEAAAQLLAYNYQVLGTWPLALTAYNHGAEGMRRARERMGTSDIVRIVREYSSPLFGFASRNFYVSFLAARRIAANPSQYFGALPTAAPPVFHEVRLGAPAGVALLSRTLALDAAALRELNPALRADVWSGKRAVPAGYRLRLPPTHGSWTSEALLAALRASPPVPATVVSTSPAGAAAQASAEQAAVARTGSSRGGEPVTAAQASTLTPTLLPDGGGSLAIGAFDLGVSERGTIRVAAGESLAHYALWLDQPVERLRAVNKLGRDTALAIGRQVQLDFSQVQREQFEQRRRSYHQRLQAAYFAEHTITGVSAYRTRVGDTLWDLARRHGGMPEWLLQQYNPDVDFTALRPGTQVVLPEVR